MATSNLGQSEAVRGIREIYESFQSLLSINPKQDPGFVIQHLEQVFNTGGNIDVKLESGVGCGDKRDPKNEILTRIQTVFNVYKTLCKYNLDGAPAVLIQNLREILSTTEDAKAPDVNMEISPVEEENDLNIKIVMTQSLSNDDAPQRADDIEDFHQNPEADMKSTTFYYKCSTCSQFFQDGNEWENHRRHHELPNSQNIHERFCSESPGNEQTESSSIPLEEKYIPSTSTNTNTNANNCGGDGDEEPGELLIRKSHPTPVHDGSETMKSQIKKFILTTSKNTLISVGLKPSSFPTRDKKYPCHMCQDEDFKSLEKLANHIRFHFPELEEPFQCFHPKCDRRFRDSINFQKHLKYPHMENGTCLIPGAQRNSSRSSHSQTLQKKNQQKKKKSSKSKSGNKKRIKEESDEEEQEEVPESQRIIQLPIRRKHKTRPYYKISGFKSPPSFSKSQKSYRCDPCDKTFLTLSSLTTHVVSHIIRKEKNEPRVCVLCRKQFDDKESRITHQKMAHKINGRFHCHLCKSDFKSSLNLVTHLNIRHS